ncbi:MAG: 2-phosphoglycerate kinase [Myxococcales bacterium]|nr:2-phosphoglycerate kinase [Myxococcales bacterium]
MAESGDNQHEWSGDSDPDRILVEDASNRRPFMRGIMVHSLMARGIAFEEAYRTANQIRERLRGRLVVPKEELAKAILEICGPPTDRVEPALAAADEITITGRGRGLPFSKGILSQSLLAAAIEPNDAFDVARDIERDLVNRRAREVDRRELRGLAYQVLSRKIGAEVARRYLVWRKYQDPDRPVIILLGGAAGVGKTSLALEVAHRLGIGRVLSTDSIRQIMRLMLSPALAPAIHGSSYDAHKLLPSERKSADRVIGGFREQAATVSVGIRASLERAVNENASLVMDGVSIVPGLIDLESFSEIADVIFLVVGTLDEDAFSNRFAARAAEVKDRPPHRYLENLDSILQIQDHFLELAERFEVPIVDNISFDRSVQLIIRHVTDTLSQRHGFDPKEIL